MKASLVAGHILSGHYTREEAPSAFNIPSGAVDEALAYFEEAQELILAEESASKEKAGI